MLRLLAALAAVLLLTAASGAQQPIRLVVIVVLDQFRADYLTTFASHWRAGFKTLLSEGAVFTRAQYPYFHTDTCAGHFTIGTGTFPRTHGMVADNWWETQPRRLIECTDDDQAPVFSYGRPSKLGKSARNSKAPSFADELRGLMAFLPYGRFSLAIRSRPTSGSSGCCATPGKRIATLMRVSGSVPGSLGPGCSRMRSGEPQGLVMTRLRSGGPVRSATRTLDGWPPL